MVAMEDDPILQSRLNLLMEHREERQKEEGNWAQTILQVVEPIKGRFNRSDWSDDVIQRSVGLIRTNATQTLASCCSQDRTNVFDGELATVRVLYPSMSPLSHSCMPNTRIIHRWDYILEARTLKEVRLGEEFTISYTGKEKDPISYNEEAYTYIHYYKIYFFGPQGNPTVV